jgi:rhodanese-related sulfurtransferase
MTQAPDPRDSRLHAGLLAIALILGALALLVDSPEHSEEDLENRTSAIGLAQRLHDRQPGLRVVDLRSEAAYQDYHLPQAKRLTAEEFLASLDSTGSSIVVVYGSGDGMARVAADTAHEAGYDQVYFLADGVGEWLEEVLNPALDTSGTLEQRAEVERVAALSRYFGGRPRFGKLTDDSAAVPLDRPRRGCGI